MKKFRTSVIGANGLTGRELVRILSGHSSAEVGDLYSRADAGRDISDIYPDLKGSVSGIMKKPSPEAIEPSDVIFLALPHTKSAEYMPYALEKASLVVDLSADYRFTDPHLFEKHYKVKHPDPERLSGIPYALPEINRDEIKEVNAIANPGCYATASILAIYPLLAEGLVKERVFVDAKSGISGAGKKVASEYLFINRNENLTPYNVNKHRHMGEIVDFLQTATGSSWDKLVFCPQLLPVYRGILVCAYAELRSPLTQDAASGIYEKYYGSEHFINIKKDGEYPQISDVAGTNNVSIGVEISSDGKSAVVMSAIDNLIKGAAGQAVQNMNIALGITETEGLI